MNLLVSDPLPDPNKRRPRSIRGNMAAVFFKKMEAAKVDDPRTQRNENKNTPTAKVKLKK